MDEFPGHADSDAAREARTAWRADCSRETQAELGAGSYVDADDMRAWIKTVGTKHELPPPPTRRR